MTLRQQQPVLASVLDQSTAGFYKSLLQARQRPLLDPLRQHQPPPQIPQIVGDHTQPEPHLVRSEPMATEPRHLLRPKEQLLNRVTEGQKDIASGYLAFLSRFHDSARLGQGT